MLNFVLDLLTSSVRISIPIALAALGGVVSERAGVMNLALEGHMLVGAFAGMIGSFVTGSPWAGMVIAAASGMVFSLLMCYMSVTMRANQIVSATAINIAALGLTGYLLKVFNTVQGQSNVTTVTAFNAVHIPLLSDLPVLGELLFSYKPMTYMTVILVILTHIYLYKTKSGLVLRSIGEYPQAADVLGININRVRYKALIYSGFLCGLAGAYMSLSQLNQFQNNMTSGRGYIAFAAVIFGRWKPAGAALAALLFGFADALQMRVQAMQIGISHHLLQTFPYLVTIIILVSFIGKSESPAADGIPYHREEV
jgi:simple sugar transport system permease protein